MIPFFVKRFFAELRKKSHELSNMKFMVFYTSKLLIEDKNYQEKLNICLGYQKEFILNNKNADFNSLYNSYKEMPRKIIDSSLSQQTEIKKDWNYFYKKGYDTAFSKNKEENIYTDEHGFISGFKAGSELYRFYNLPTQ